MQVAVLGAGGLDVQTKTSSMSRTTGYTCTAMLGLMAEKIFTKKGVYPPELVGSDKKCFEFVLQHRAERNIKINKTVS